MRCPGCGGPARVEYQVVDFSASEWVARPFIAGECGSLYALPGWF